MRAAFTTSCALLVSNGDEDRMVLSSTTTRRPLSLSRDLSVKYSSFMPISRLESLGGANVLLHLLLLSCSCTFAQGDPDGPQVVRLPYSSQAAFRDSFRRMRGGLFAWTHSWVKSQQ